MDLAGIGAFAGAVRDGGNGVAGAVDDERGGAGVRDHRWFDTAACAGGLAMQARCRLGWRIGTQGVEGESPETAHIVDDVRGAGGATGVAPHRDGQQLRGGRLAVAALLRQRQSRNTAGGRPRA
ncbi:hypothetical protein D3C86_1485380 [compost metagenome]